MMLPMRNSHGTLRKMRCLAFAWISAPWSLYACRHSISR